MYIFTIMLEETAVSSACLITLQLNATNVVSVNVEQNRADGGPTRHEERQWSFCRVEEGQ